MDQLEESKKEAICKKCKEVGGDHYYSKDTRTIVSVCDICDPDNTGERKEK